MFPISFNIGLFPPSFEFECPLQVSTRLGKKYVTNSEEELAKITLNFFDNPLGTSYDNYDRKIHNAKKEAKKIWDVTKNFEKFFDWAKKICEWKGIITNLIGFIDGFLAFTTAAAKVLKAIPPTAVAGESLDKGASAACAGPKAVLENSK